MLKKFEYLGEAREFSGEIHEIFNRVPLLDSLDLHETALLCNFLTCYAAPRGSALVEEGERGDYMLFLLTGRAEVINTDSNGIIHVVGFAEPGDALGEMAMIDHQPRAATCIAVEPVDFAVLTEQAFRDILLTLPRLGNKLLLLLLHVMAERLRRSQRELLPQLPISMKTGLN